MWLAAGVLKLPDPAASVRAVRAVRAYELLPESTVTAVGHLLPLAEVALGSFLVVGLLTRASAVVSVLLLAAFIVGHRRCLGPRGSRSTAAAAVVAAPRRARPGHADGRDRRRAGRRVGAGQHRCGAGRDPVTDSAGDPG
ncbi:MAG: MauE/DoxX family redox-associated membrane protein [Nocardioides sp.]